MRADELLDLIGAADDRYLEEAERVGRDHWAEVRRWLLATACLCALVAGALSAAHYYKYHVNVIIPGGPAAEDNIVNVFWAGDREFYLRRDGELHRCDDREDVLVHTFPTYLVTWSTAHECFVYFERGVVRFYDAASDAMVREIPAEIETNGKSCYVTLVSGRYVYLRCGMTSYRLELERETLEESPWPVRDVLYNDGERAIFKATDIQRLFVYDLAADEAMMVVNEVSVSAFTSACLVGDTLYYTRSDGIIRSCPLAPLAEEERRSGTLIGMQTWVLGIASTSEGLLCVVGEPQGDLYMPQLLVYRFDGMREYLPDAGLSLYRQYGSCRMAVHGERYLLALITDSAVFRGVWTGEE